MKPIQIFEARVRDAWRTDADKPVRAEKLNKVADAINHYVARVKDEVDYKDPWKATTTKRLLRHLDALARDAKNMAAQLNPPTPSTRGRRA